MTELKARVSGLKTFCTARYLRKSASRGFGWLSILKDVYSKQCRLLAHRDKSQSPEFTVGIDAERTLVDKRSRPNLQRMRPKPDSPSLLGAAATP